MAVHVLMRRVLSRSRSSTSSVLARRGNRAPHRPRDLRAVVAGVRGEVRFNARLRDLTSFRIGGPADALVIPADVEALARLVRQAWKARCPIFVMGGTNVLVRDGGIRGVVVSLAKLKAISDEGIGVVYAEGGVGMPTLIQYAIRHSLAGLEWAAGIPGTVGGCLVMNAGTRLGEMKSAVKTVRLIDPRGGIRDCPASRLTFKYRRTNLPRGIVVGVWLQLTPSPRARVSRVVKDYLRYRKETQPLTLHNAGCVFRNPPDKSAGQLIEEVGMKGARVGDAQVSEKHANFVVNLGDASAADVMTLIKKVMRAVERRTGEKLQLELKIVGQP